MHLSFPNPASHQIQLEFTSSARRTISLYTSHGACVQSFEIVDSTTELVTSGYTPGVYYLLVADEKGVNTKMIEIH